MVDREDILSDIVTLVDGDVGKFKTLEIIADYVEEVKKKSQIDVWQEVLKISQDKLFSYRNLDKVAESMINELKNAATKLEEYNNL